MSRPRVRSSEEAEYLAEVLSRYVDDYWTVLQQSNLADKSIEDYFYFAFAFVRWVNGEFTPGSHT